MIFESLAAITPALLVLYRPEGISTGFTLGSFTAGSATGLGLKLLSGSRQRTIQGLSTYPEANLPISVLSYAPPTEIAQSTQPAIVSFPQSDLPTVFNITPSSLLLCHTIEQTRRDYGNGFSSLDDDFLVCRRSNTYPTGFSIPQVPVEVPSHVAPPVCSIWETIAPPHPTCAALEHMCLPSEAPTSGPVCSIWETIAQPHPTCAVLEQVCLPSEAPMSGPVCSILETIAPPHPTCAVLEHVCLPSEAPTSGPVCSIWETIAQPHPTCAVFEHVCLPSEAPRPGPMCLVPNTIAPEPVLECPAGRIEPLLWTPSERQSITFPVCAVLSPPPCQSNAPTYSKFGLRIIITIVVLLMGMVSTLKLLETDTIDLHDWPITTPKSPSAINTPQSDQEALFEAISDLLLSTIPAEDGDMLQAQVNNEAEDPAVATSSAIVLDDKGDTATAQEPDLAAFLLPYILSPSGARNDTFSEQIETLLLQLLPEDECDSGSITPETISVDLPETDAVDYVGLDSISSSGTLVSLASIDPHTVERDAPVSGSLSASSSTTATSETKANVKKNKKNKKKKKKKKN